MAMYKPVTASMVVKHAIGELGYTEKASNSQLDDKYANAGHRNYTKYARDMYEAGFYNGNKQGFAWCDVGFDANVFYVCGDKERTEYILCQSGDCGAGVDFSRSYYKAAGRLDKNPKVGDQIFFGKNGGDHTGLLEEINGNRITAIEFNADDQVKRKYYDLDDPYICDFGHPRYDPEYIPQIPTIKIRFNTVEECPYYSRPTISKLVKKGLLKGNGEGLNLSEDMIRIFVVLDRAGLYDMI